MIARDGELPEVLEKKVWNKPVVGIETAHRAWTGRRIRVGGERLIP